MHQVTFLTSKPQDQAFTLVELLVVVSVLAIMGALLVPGVTTSIHSAKGSACLANMKRYGDAILLFSAENNGLPWWEGTGIPASQRDPRSTTPSFGTWVEPYLFGTPEGKLRRLHCPLGSATIFAKSKQSGYIFNYTGNGSLCTYYPRLHGIPAPHSRVVLAMEGGGPDVFWAGSQMNMAMWGIGEADQGRKTTFSQFQKVKGSHTKRPNPQMHGPENHPGMHAYFLDGHAALVSPTEGNWFKAPNYGSPKKFVGKKRPSDGNERKRTSEASEGQVFGGTW